MNEGVDDIFTSIDFKLEINKIKSWKIPMK